VSPDWPRRGRRAAFHKELLALLDRNIGSGAGEATAAASTNAAAAAMH
jgi:hypothetical protein